MSVGTIGPLILLFISLHVSVPELDFMLGKFVLPSGVTWLYVLAMGLLATLAQVYMTKAYGASKAGIIGAVSYTNIPFSILIGLFLGDSLPTFITTIGIVFIVTAGIMVAKEK
jgi:drug/metabolite transporter (DMT)-like permease